MDRAEGTRPQRPTFHVHTAYNCGMIKTVDFRLPAMSTMQLNNGNGNKQTVRYTGRLSSNVIIRATKLLALTTEAQQIKAAFINFGKQAALPVTGLQSHMHATGEDYHQDYLTTNPYIAN